MSNEDTRGPVFGSVKDRPPPRRSLTPDDRILLVGSLGVLLAVFALVYMNVAANHSPKRLLPGFWRTLSQILPPGAGVTSLRDVAYFNGHGSSHALIVLAVYAVLGAGVALIAYRLRTPAAAATPAG